MTTEVEAVMVDLDATNVAAKLVTAKGLLNTQKKPVLLADDVDLHCHSLLYTFRRHPSPGNGATIEKFIRQTLVPGQPIVVQQCHSARFVTRISKFKHNSTAVQYLCKSRESDFVAGPPKESILVASILFWANIANGSQEGTITTRLCFVVSWYHSSEFRSEAAASPKLGREKVSWHWTD